MCDHSSNQVNACDRDKPESLMFHVCDHSLCRLCLIEYINKAIQSTEIVIRCPVAPSCTGVVSYYDIERVCPELTGKYTQMIRETVQARDKPQLWSNWTDEQPMQCPSCKLWMYRNDGCEVIWCICGFRFCSTCKMMYAGCRC